VEFSQASPLTNQRIKVCPGKGIKKLHYLSHVIRSKDDVTPQDLIRIGGPRASLQCLCASPELMGEKTPYIILVNLISDPADLLGNSIRIQT